MYFVLLGPGCTCVRFRICWGLRLTET